MTAALLADDLGARTRSALERVRQAEQAHQGFVDRVERQRAELEALMARVGRDVVAAGDHADAVAERLSGEVARLRAAVDVSERTVTAAADKLEETVLAALAAEADDVAELREQAQAELDKHRVRGAELLRKLQEHEGWEYVQRSARIDDGSGVLRTIDEPRSWVLATAVRRLSARLVLLRIAAAGHPLPVFVQHDGIPGELYSPRLRDRPQLRDAAGDLMVLPAGLVAPGLVEDVRLLVHARLG